LAKKNKERGSWPDSENAIWAIRREMESNGFSNAFYNIGRRVLILESEWEKSMKNLLSKGCYEK
jgi:hypothetical protein